MGGPVLWEWGCWGLSGYFLLSWDGEGHWGPLLLVSSPESLYQCPSKGEWYFPWLGVVLYILVELALYFIACWHGKRQKWVKQLIIHAAIISSINMVITRISMGISQLQIPPGQEKDPPKRDCSQIVATLRTLQVVLWDPVGSECFLENSETFFNLAGGIYPEITHLIQVGSSPSLFRDQEIYPLPILQ